MSIVFVIFSVIGSILSPLMAFAVVLTTVILYFKNRNNTNFAKQIKTIAYIDAVYLPFWIIGCFASGTLVQSAGGLLEGIFDLACLVALLFCVWKMKDGNTFKSLFRNPGVGRAWFVVYMVTNFVFFYQLAITLLNYLIAGIVFLVIFLIADRALGLGAGTALLSGMGGAVGGGGASGHCGTCRHYAGGSCSQNPGSVTGSMDSCGSYSPK